MRYLGNDALTQIKTNNINPVLMLTIKESIMNIMENFVMIHPPKNNIVVKRLINMIEPYSAKKKRANPILEYSTLKPETSSDSASGKSKGALFVSAKIDIKNIKNNTKNGIQKKTKH
jgi:hypothetical protein